MRAGLLLALAALAGASPAFAGPQGSGLWRTEAVAREAASRSRSATATRPA